MQSRVDMFRFPKTVEDTTRKFPIAIVDDFFEDPAVLYNWAATTEYIPTNGRYPGKRSDYLCNIDKNLNDHIANKILSVFFDLENCRFEYKFEANFQKIRPQEDPELNIAWTHFDLHSVLGGIVYLDPEPMKRSGTTFGYCIADDVDEYEERQDYRVDFQQGKDVDLVEYKKHLNYNNENYVETVTVENVYNRLVVFDGLNYHRINYGDDPSRERHTLVFFFTKLTMYGTEAPFDRHQAYQIIGA